MIQLSSILIFLWFRLHHYLKSRSYSCREKPYWSIVSCTHMAEAAPHHLELIDQLLVQGTHFWVHQLLVHGQADSEDVDLWETNQVFECAEREEVISTGFCFSNLSY